MVRRPTKIEFPLIGLPLLFALLWWKFYCCWFHLASKSTSIKCKCGVSIFSVLVLPSTHLYLYKHTHADMLTPHYSKWTVKQQHLQPTFDHNFVYNPFPLFMLVDLMQCNWFNQGWEWILFCEPTTVCPISMSCIMLRPWCFLPVVLWARRVQPHISWSGTNEDAENQ